MCEKEEIAVRHHPALAVVASFVVALVRMEMVVV